MGILKENKQVTERKSAVVTSPEDYARINDLIATNKWLQLKNERNKKTYSQRL